MDSFWGMVLEEMGIEKNPPKKRGVRMGMEVPTSAIMKVGAAVQVLYVGDLLMEMERYVRNPSDPRWAGAPPLTISHCQG